MTRPPTRSNGLALQPQEACDIVVGACSNSRARSARRRPADRMRLHSSVFPGELHMWVLGLRQQRRFSIESMCRFSFVWGLGLFPAFPSYLPAYAPTRVKAKFSSGLGCADDDALGCLFACLGGLGLLPAHLFYKTTCPKHLGSQL